VSKGPSKTPAEAPEAQDGCRADVWLWRARFFKTRPLAAAFLDKGRVRLQRDGRETRLDKPSRTLKVGDGVVFALGGKLVAIRVEALGDRRGPASEARTLYSELEPPEDASEGGSSDG
jgi:ribosomal 50S subunit-recycling heat shock protein